MLSNLPQATLPLGIGGTELGDYTIVDDSRAPIVHVQVIDEPTDESYEQYLTDVTAAFRGLDRFGMVFNSGELGQLPARYRARLSEWLSETEGEFKGRWLCAAFVIKSRMIRGVLSAIFWLNRPYYDVKVFGTEEEAWEWTRHQLEEAGVSVSLSA